MGYSAKLAQRARTSGELTGKHQVIIEYQYKNNRTKFKVEGVFAAPNQWNTNTQEITSGHDRQTLKNLNGKINSLKKRISDILHHAHLADIEPSHGYVKKEMEKPVQEKTKLAEDIPEMYKIWMEERGVPKYTTTYEHIKDFATYRKGLKVGEIDKSLLAEFCNYLCTQGYVPYKKPAKGEKRSKKKVAREMFTNTSIKNHIKYFKLFLKEYVVGKGYNIDQSFRDYSAPFKTPEVLDVVALTKQEFDTLYYLQIPEGKQHLHLTRIAFIIGTALGGVRISDLKKLDERSFKNGSVKFRQIKTGGKVENPLSKSYVEPFLEEFLEKRHKIPSGQKFNENLKAIAEMAGFDRVEWLEEYRAGSNKPEEVKTPIVDHISSKYMRKSFISMMVEEGVEREIIMEFTGHEDEKILRHYIQVHRHTKMEVLERFRPDESMRPAEPEKVIPVKEEPEKVVSSGGNK